MANVNEDEDENEDAPEQTGSEYSFPCAQVSL